MDVRLPEFLERWHALVVLLGVAAIALMTGLAILLVSQRPYRPPNIHAWTFPFVTALLIFGYTKRYQAHDDADILLPATAIGSLFLIGVHVLTAAGIIIGQRLDGVQLANQSIFLIEMGFGGSLVGIVVGHFHGLAQANRRELAENRTRLVEQFNRLDRERSLKDTIQNVLVELSDREQIEQAFCESIAEDGFPLVCICERSPDDGVLVRAAAGELGERNEPPAFVTDPDSPVSVAIDRREAVVIDDCQEEDDAWNEAASAAGVRSAIASPLSYNQLSYGILLIGAADPGAFSPPQRQDLVSDITQSISYAIHNTQQRAMLRSDQPIRAKFRIAGGDDYLFDIANTESLDQDFTISVMDLGETDADEAIQFLTVKGAQIEEVIDLLESLESLPKVETLAGAADRPGEHLMTKGVSLSLTESITGVNGSIQSIRVQPGSVTVDALFPPSIDLNEVLDAVRNRFEDVTLVTKTQADPVDQKFRAGVEHEFTTKQLNALRIAYFNGFFDRPQANTAEDLAPELGVSRSTFLSHLRAAENTLLGEFLTRSQR